jgi:coenzyme F420-reducing hydrogenase beta subunit
MTICDEKKCTGCSACVNACRQNAIQLVENDQGFLYPKIIATKCVSCGLCIKVCPVNNPPIGNMHKGVYAALAKNDSDRAKSTSGGIFACLAKRIIAQGGYVYGVILDDRLVVRHAEAHSLEELDRMRNSKYVQSDVGLCYRLAESRLKEGKPVLFSGTPCQIGALRNFLKKEYSNLLTVDILCHGVPSPGLFRKYVKSEESLASASMTDIKFRTKVIGWKTSYCTRTFDNGAEASWGDSFVPGFLENLYLRESCYSCSYATEDRQGDITLGDYWGYKESAPEYIEDDDKGISLVIVNTDKGERAYRSIRNQIASAKRTMDDAKKSNIVLSGPELRSANYDAFWQDAKTMEWNELTDKYFFRQKKEDRMNPELREYYSIPYSKRHFRHVFHIYKTKLLRKLRLRRG